MTRGRIRVLVADDSATMRAALTTLLREDPLIDVVGQASDGVEAVERAKQLRPDVITMDVKMPRLDGLEATAAIMATVPVRILVVCAVTEASQQDVSFRAMAAGALELIAKPQSGSQMDLRAWGKRVAEAVCLMAEVPVVTRRRPALAPLADPIDRVRRLRQTGPGTVDAFAVVASTGGPPALASILGALPADLPVPLFIAQHMAAGFVAGLMRWLASVTPMRVLVAQSGSAALPGHVYLPPDGHDLVVDDEGLLKVLPSPGGHCPSGDRLLTSLARAYGARAGAVVLTGMGDDGAAGLLALRQAGGATFSQDESSSVVYGMPRAAWEKGASQFQIPLESVAAAIRNICERRRM